MRRILLFFLLLLPAAAAAQGPGTLKTQMNRIEAAYGVYFVYDAALPVDVPASREVDTTQSLQKNLRALFDDTDITWRMWKQYVVLTRTAPEPCPCPTLAWPEPAYTMRVDTLREAIKIARQYDCLSAGSTWIDPVQSQKIVTPLGGGDVFRFIQTQPGVSTGGEGTTALFVRGSDMGANRVTLDGVPVYGVSHLMGLASVFPDDIIGTSEFRVGGFHSDEGNLTASHLQMKSYNGDFERFRSRISISPFFVSASMSTPLVKEKLSFLGSVRYSPVGLEYKAFKERINRRQQTFYDYSATVGDVYGKLAWRPDARNEVALFFFGSRDEHRFMTDPEWNYEETLGWSNAVAGLSWDRCDALGFDCIHTAVSYNSHLWEEQLDWKYKVYTSTKTDTYQILNSLDELMVQISATRRLDRWSFTAGMKLQRTWFNPGAVRNVRLQYLRGAGSQSGQDNEVNHYSQAWMPTLHGEIGYEVPERFQLRLSLRGNGYFLKETDQDASTSWFHPEASLSARVWLLPQLGLEATLDYLTQYYHFLEVRSTGWAPDPILPANADLPPERVKQAYFGLFGGVGEHAFRAGAFYKQMDGLVYFSKSAGFFNQQDANFDTKGSNDGIPNLYSGEGTAYGAELLYDKTGRDLSWHLAYTWSKTDRHFDKINQGEFFPPRYDRRHMLNARAEWKGLTAAFTFQSGHCESVSAAQLRYGQHAYDQYMRYYGFNNVRVPAHIRLDLGYRLSFRSGQSHPVSHNLTFGVYNVFNRHNPSMLTFDADAGTWKYISFFPIMPSISYVLEL